MRNRLLRICSLLLTLIRLCCHQNLIPRSGFVHGIAVSTAPKERYNDVTMRYPIALLFVCTLVLAPLSETQAQSAQFTIGMEILADTTPPTVPQNVSHTVIASVPQVDITWSASTDAESGVAYYNIYRDTILYASTTATSFSDLGVAVGNSYVYRISAVDNASNESAQSAPTTANVSAPSGGGDPTPPSIPQDLAASVALGPPSVTLSWSPSTDDQSGISHYRIYRNGTFINTSTITEYVDFNVATGTTYTYRVSAVDNAGNQSAQSNQVTAVIPTGEPLDTTPPTVPQNLTASINAAAPSVTLTWHASSDSQSGVAFYRIYRNTTLYATTTTTTLVDPAVVEGTTYTYRVSAVDGAGNESAQSNEVIASIPVPDTTPPTVPQNVTANAVPGPAIEVSWNASTDTQSGVGYYRIFRNDVLIATTSGLTYVDSAVTPGSTYTYRVGAVDNAGNASALSAPAPATVPADPTPPDPIDPSDPPDEPDPVDPPDPSPGPADPTGPDAPGPASGGPSGPGLPSDPSDPSAPPEDEIPVEADPPEPSAPPASVEERRPIIPRDVLPVLRREAREVTSRVTTGAREQAARTVERVSENPDTSRVIVVGTAVTGLFIPAVELGLISAASGTSFWYALLMRVRDFGQFVSWLFSWLGIRKRRRPWGTVYDSVTKQPLDPAYVELLDRKTGESIASAITDLDGRYGFSPEPGEYTLKAAKTNYVFPSKRVAGSKEDIIYNHLYFGDSLTITDDESTLIAHDIPMDPTTFDWNEFEKRRLGVMKYYSRFGLVLHIVTQALFYVGFVLALTVLYLSPTPINIGVVVIYVIIMLLRKIYMKPQTKGRVIDSATGAPIAYASVEVYLPEQPDRPVKKVPTDEAGRYYCLIQPNEYFVIIKEQLQDGSFRPIFQSEVFDTKKGVIDERFKV